MLRARKIQRFLSQPFGVAQVFTGHEGKQVPVKETVRVNMSGTTVEGSWTGGRAKHNGPIDIGSRPHAFTCPNRQQPKR